MTIVWVGPVVSSVSTVTLVWAASVAGSVSTVTFFGASLAVSSVNTSFAFWVLMLPPRPLCALAGPLVSHERLCATSGWHVAKRALM